MRQIQSLQKLNYVTLLMPNITYLASSDISLTQKIAYNRKFQTITIIIYTTQNFMTAINVNTLKNITYFYDLKIAQKLQLLSTQ